MSTIVEQLMQGQIETRFGEITETDVDQLIIRLATLSRHPSTYWSGDSQRRADDPNLTAYSKRYYAAMEAIKVFNNSVQEWIMRKVGENGYSRRSAFWIPAADLFNFFDPQVNREDPKMSKILKQILGDAGVPDFGEITEADVDQLVIALATVARKPVPGAPEQFQSIMDSIKLQDRALAERIEQRILHCGVYTSTAFWRRPADMFNSFTPK